MRNGSKKILIIVITVIAILAVIGGVLAFLFISTDTFKSDKELFKKYFAQNIEEYKQMADSKTYKIYQNLKDTELYETNTEIGIKYSEGGEVSNPLNDFSLKFKTQKENENIYRDAQILFQDEEYLEIEGIKEDDVYGIRFTDVFRQFISVRNDEEIMQVPNNIELDPEMLQTVFSIIEGNYSVMDSIITKEEANTLKERYMNIVLENVQNATYTSQKKAMITLNNNTVKVNSYGLELSSDQVQNLIVQILNNIKTDDIIIDKLEKYNLTDREEFENQIDEILENLGIDQKIPSIKITVYEQNGITVRTTIDTEIEKITIENSKQEGKSIIKIQETILDEEEEKQKNIEISKLSTDSNETYNVKMEVIEGEDEYTIITEMNTKISDMIETKLTSEYQKGITKIEVNFDSSTNTTEIGDKIKLNQNNNVILNDIEETMRKRVISSVETEVPKRIMAKTATLLEKLQLTQSIEQILNTISNNQQVEETPEITDNIENSETQISQIEINKFNAKFEFYTGDSVSTENVKALMEEVKNNLASVEITPIETAEQQNDNEVKEIIKLNIEKDKANVELANGILEKIKENLKYKVSISYSDTNGIIESITIREVEK